MNKLIIATTALIVVASSCQAEMLIGADAEVEIKKNSTTKNYETVTTLGLNFATDQELAFGGFNIDSKDGGTFALDEWNIGTTIGVAKVSFGKQGGIFPEDISDTGNGSVATITMNESLSVEAYGLSVALGLDDYKNDVFGNNDNIQVAYTIDGETLDVTAGIDYNIDTEESVYGTRVDLSASNIAVGGIMTYGTNLKTVAYEADATIMGVTAYINGDQNDMTENVGAGYEMEVGGLTTELDMNYNFDAEQVTPKFTVGFSF
jgi:hypothetical protein|tara:strand:+ start:11259 stop:12044 length:786 start_codon:yes stop_codon:yes gene_type:complete